MKLEIPTLKELLTRPRVRFVIVVRCCVCGRVILFENMVAKRANFFSWEYTCDECVEKINDFRKDIRSKTRKVKKCPVK